MSRDAKFFPALDSSPFAECSNAKKLFAFLLNYVEPHAHENIKTLLSNCIKQSSVEKNVKLFVKQTRGMDNKNSSAFM